jgi:hypothetical protein
MVGGLGWQSISYGQNMVDQGTDNTAVGFVATEIKAWTIDPARSRLVVSEQRIGGCPPLFVAVVLADVVILEIVRS